MRLDRGESIKVKLLFIFLMSLLMSLVMSFALMAINTGIDNDYAARSLGNFVLAFPIAFTSALVAAPTLSAIITKLLVKRKSS